MWHRTLGIGSILLLNSIALLGEAHSAEEESAPPRQQIRVFQELLILSDLEVAKDLELTDAQSSAVQELKQKFYAEGGKTPRLTSNPTNELVEAIRAAMHAREKEFQPKVWEILKGDQKERFQQLLWQFDVIRALQYDPNVIKQVELTSQQRDALEEVYLRFLQDTEDAGDRKANQEDLQRLLVEAENRRNAGAIRVLTEQQLTIWKGMTGVGLDMDALRPRVDLRKGLRDAFKEFGPLDRRRRQRKSG